MTKNNIKKTIAGVALVSFLAAIAGLIVSSLNIKEDVTSTAHTLFEYFPLTYRVMPASTWEGAMILGIFITVLQIVTSSIMMSSEFTKLWRITAFVSFISACYFDNWTDIVHRSSNLTGNLQIATISTLYFYTLGSELLQGFSWLLLIKNWRKGISDLMWGIAVFSAGVSSISAEWSKFRKAAERKEGRDRNTETYVPSDMSSSPPHKPFSSPSKNATPITTRPTPKPVPYGGMKKPSIEPTYHPVPRKDPDADMERFLTNHLSIGGLELTDSDDIDS